MRNFASIDHAMRSVACGNLPGSVWLHDVCVDACHRLYRCLFKAEPSSLLLQPAYVRTSEALNILGKFSEHFSKRAFLMARFCFFFSR